MSELKQLQKSPIDGVRVIMNEECVTDVQADINGPGMQSPAAQPRCRTPRGHSRTPVCRTLLRERVSKSTLQAIIAGYLPAAVLSSCSPDARPSTRPFARRGYTV
jgi:anti-sigma factor RsiW